MYNYLLLLNGPFASGKSTIAEALAAIETNIVLCDWDYYSKNISESKYKRKLYRFKKLVSEIEKGISDNKDIIVPNTICDVEKISKLRKKAEDNNYNFLHIKLKLSKKEALQRLNNRRRNDSISFDSFDRTWNELKLISVDKEIVVTDKEISIIAYDILSTIKPELNQS